MRKLILEFLFPGISRSFMNETCAVDSHIPLIIKMEYINISRKTSFSVHVTEGYKLKKNQRIRIKEYYKNVKIGNIVTNNMHLFNASHC